MKERKKEIITKLCTKGQFISRRKKKFIQWIFKKQDLLKGVHIKRKIFSNAGSWLKDHFSLVFTSTTVNWGYQDNFKLVYLFIYLFILRKVFKRTKSTKAQSKQFLPSEWFLCAQKPLPLLFFVCLVLFC